MECFVEVIVMSLIDYDCVVGVNSIGVGISVVWKGVKVDYVGLCLVECEGVVFGVCIVDYDCVVCVDVIGK